MEDSNKVFPYLVKRYDSLIDSKISKIREEREEQAKELNQFKNELLLFRGDSQFSYIDMVTFLESTEPKNYLIGHFIHGQNIGESIIKSDALEQILDIPKYDYLIDFHSSFKNWSREKLNKFYDKRNKSFVAPEMTKEEKEAIIELFSIYVKDENQLQQYEELKGFCSTYNRLIENGLIRDINVPKVLAKAMEGRIVAVKNTTLFLNRYVYLLKIDYRFLTRSIEQSETIYRNRASFGGRWYVNAEDMVY